MTKLTDAQLILLSRAAERDDGAATIPAKMNKAAAMKVGASLVARKLMREARAKGPLPIWREDATGRSYSLIITRAGRDAIGLDVQTNAKPQAPAAELDTQELDAHSNSAESSQIAAKSRSSPSDADSENVHTAPRAGSKQALIIEMLSRKEGTTIEALVEATRWLPHTTRAALTGLRKRGFQIARAPRGSGGSLYRIAAGPAAQG